MTFPTRYPVPSGEHRVAVEIKGSRFIATAARAPDVGAARAFIARIREEFDDATHNCWAYVVGAPGSTQSNGSSDDGEPGGTAGLPILNVLLHSGVGDIVVVVTRYFGGTKLGRGGLVRAYGGSARRVLKDLPLAERVSFASVEIALDYPDVDTVRRLAKSHGATVTHESFGTSAVLQLEIPVEQLPGFEEEVLNATGGRARTTRTSTGDVS